MRILRLIFLLVLPLALAACEGSTAPTPPAEIEGGWLRANQPASAKTIEHLGFGAGGHYARDIMIYRDIAGGTLVSSFREEGTYRLNGDRLELRITRETEWNAERGGLPVVTERPGAWADAGTVRITDGYYMDRTYITYPADAPVQTTVRYHKVLLD